MYTWKSLLFTALHQHIHVEIDDLQEDITHQNSPNSGTTGRAAVTRNNQYAIHMFMYYVLNHNRLNEFSNRQT